MFLTFYEQPGTLCHWTCRPVITAGRLEFSTLCLFSDRKDVVLLLVELQSDVCLPERIRREWKGLIHVVPVQWFTLSYMSVIYFYYCKSVQIVHVEASRNKVTSVCRFIWHDGAVCNFRPWNKPRYVDGLKEGRAGRCSVFLYWILLNLINHFVLPK